jgi:hypothetical protein
MRASVQVAKLMLEGVEGGRYTLLFPDATSTAITSTLGGVAPLSLPWWLAAPVAFFTVGGHSARGELALQGSQHAMTIFSFY